jgi:hypothetical protein
MAFGATVHSPVNHLSDDVPELSPAREGAKPGEASS